MVMPFRSFSLHLHSELFILLDFLQAPFLDLLQLFLQASDYDFTFLKFLIFCHQEKLVRILKLTNFVQIKGTLTALKPVIIVALVGSVTWWRLFVKMIEIISSMLNIGMIWIFNKLAHASDGLTVTVFERRKSLLVNISFAEVFLNAISVLHTFGSVGYASFIVAERLLGNGLENFGATGLNVSSIGVFGTQICVLFC